MNFETMYCHNPGCELFNEEQHFAYLPTTWEAPSEWVEEPECRECMEWCKTEAVPTENLVGGLMEEIEQLGDPFYSSDDIYRLVHRFVKESSNNG